MDELYKNYNSWDYFKLKTYSEEEVWMEAYLKCPENQLDIAIKIADKTLKAFKDRFREPTNNIGDNANGC